MIQTKIISSLENVSDIAKKLKETLPKNCIIFLNGTLASGKTTLTKAIVKEFNNQEFVTSPTFSLQNIYSDDLYHYDLYRVTFEEIMKLGLYEEFEKSGWHIVEWGDLKLKTFLDSAGYNTFNITINILNSDSREYIIGA
jgi:tRNA threonylcarbamoyladenosine biosynthesis protein TsaE